MNTILGTGLSVEDTLIKEWIDVNYLVEIEDEIVNLNDFVPKEIELCLPDFGKRNKILIEVVLKDAPKEIEQLYINDQGGPWEEYVNGFHHFFNKYPQYKKLIKDQEKFEEWERQEIDY